MPGSRKPSSDELRLWRSAMRDVDRLDTEIEPPGDGTVQPDDGVGPSTSPSRPKPGVAARPAKDARRRPEMPPGVDHRTSDRLRRGRMPIAATLDLHGLTQHQAHDALVNFIDRCYRGNRRAVLVITGKGTIATDEPQATGILRRHVPRWLNEPPLRDKVLSCAPARGQHGGAGALYVLVRRRRSE